MAAATKAPERRLHVTPAGRVYRLDGVEVPSVTTILNALPKNLTQWAADAAANLAVERWDELAQLPLTKRLDTIRYAHRDTLSKAAARGTVIHGYGEQIVHGSADAVPDEYRLIAENYARELDRWGIEPIATEAAVVNTEQRFAGRGDLWATVGARDNARAYIDLKTGKSVYESVVLQATGYDGATLWQPDGPASEQPYEPVDLMFVAHITPDDVQIRPLRGAGGAVRPGVSEWRAFLYLKQTWHWLQAHGFRGEDQLVGEAEQP